MSEIKNLLTKEMPTPGVAIIIVSIIVNLVFFTQHIMLFYPYNDARAHAILTERAEFEEITIAYGHNQSVSGWMKLNVDTDDPAPLLIFFGGNAMNSSETAIWYLDGRIYQYYEGFNWLMIDYPGYGLSTGRPSDRSMFEAALASFDYMVKRADIDESNIVVMGHSIGSGVATHLAAQRDVNGLILLAAYDRGINLYNSILNIFHGPLTGLVRYPFDAAYYAKQVNVKPLIIASRDDEIINYRLTKNLASYFDEGYKLILLENIGHNFILTDPDTLVEVQTFLRSLANN